MDSKIYTEIIYEFLLPHVAEKGILYLHQDNDPKHTSKLCQKALENIDLIWVKSKKNVRQIFDDFRQFKFLT